MTIARDEDIITPEIIEETFNYTEFFDIERFFIPAEIYISDKKIAW